MGLAMTSPAFALRPSPPRIGFLGIGWFGLKRLDWVGRTGVASVAAVCDPARDRVARARALATGATVCSSLDQLIDLELDGVVISTPGADYAAQCIECLDWGLPVFCQRPLARSAAETTAVVLEAQGQDCLLDVDLSFRQAVAVEAIRDLAGSGGLGELYRARLCFHNSSATEQAWPQHPRLTGGGCVADLGIHLVDLAVRVMGSPVASVERRQLSGEDPHRRPPEDLADDHARALLRLESGAEVQIDCSWSPTLGVDASIEAHFVGTRGEARLRNVNGGYDFRATHTRGMHTRVLVEPPDDWAPRALASWARRLGEGAGFDCEAWDMVHLARVVDEIYERPLAGR
jgi:predicted dehydrogenase